jgi:hypothetical protein
MARPRLDRVHLAFDPVGIVAQLFPHRVGLRCDCDDPQLTGLFLQTRRPFAARDVRIQDHANSLAGSVNNP